jgi:4-amino-4-deoxy-L-arabinose transferase-like glycosyltransferase
VITDLLSPGRQRIIERIRFKVLLMPAAPSHSELAAQDDTAPDRPFLVQCFAIGLLALSVAATPKQPPMMQWLAWLVVHLAYPTNFYAVLLTQVLNLAGLAYLFAVLQTVTGRKDAIVWVLLFAGSGYIVLDPLTTALNADVIQFPFWAAVLFHGMRATQRRSLIHWLAFALACTGAFYTKYTVLLFLFSLGIASLIVAEFRVLWRDRGFYIAVVLFCLLISPHLVAATHTPSASEYAMERFEFDRSVGARAHDLGQLGLGFVVFLFPSWITVSALVWAKGVSVTTDKEPAAGFVRVVTVASLVVLAILVAGGLTYPFRYDSPYAFLAPVMAATYIRFDTPKWRIAKPWIMGVAFFAPLITLVSGLLGDGVFRAVSRQNESK